MKKLRDIKNRFGSLVGIMLAIASAITFWFATAPKASAGNTVTLCHKLTTDIAVEFGSIDYRRHIDHGDTQGSCNPTGTQNQ